LVRFLLLLTYRKSETDERADTDVGACQMIVDGKIKLKNNTEIERFTPTGLKFKDGSELEADVVLFATGCAHLSFPLSHTHIWNSFGDARGSIRNIVGEEAGSKVTPIWGLNAEGELRTAWREVGLTNMWYMMGNLAWCRFFSKHLALRTSRSLTFAVCT
jgi:hypothetical protein